MRLDKVFIDGFKNLKSVNIDFDESRLTTVIIGQNGSGKSNLLEAIVHIFRNIDMNKSITDFKYRISYRISNNSVILTNLVDENNIEVNGIKITRKNFDENRSDYFPDLIFGYHSGTTRKLEQLFDSHQRRYYDAIKHNDNADECSDALRERRLFYCRPVHGVLALLSLFAFPDADVLKLLKEKVGITGFHSALALFREPWYAKGGKNRKLENAKDLWGAKGVAGTTARAFRDVALLPISIPGNAIDDYRDKQQTEAQYACFLMNSSALAAFAKSHKNDSKLFYALESTDISDLIRSVHVWVSRAGDDSGEVGFDDLSDGERQLLMVLGLLRISRGKRALFLLDEPDSHLNPSWQHAYLDLIREWTGQAADSDSCHIILTSHNPLTIAGLEKSEVRIVQIDEDGKTIVTPPYVDPRGMGFTSTLTEIFGLPSSLDPKTQTMVDNRNSLARIDERNEAQERQLIEINDKLDHLGFMFESREPLYQDFLRALHDVRYADKPLLTQEQLASKQKAMSDLIRNLMAKEGSQ